MLRYGERIKVVSSGDYNEIQLQVEESYHQTCGNWEESSRMQRVSVVGYFQQAPKLMLSESLKMLKIWSRVPEQTTSWRQKDHFLWKHKFGHTGLLHLGQQQKATKILNPMCLRVSVQDLVNILLGRMNTVATMRKDFQDFPHHAYAYPTSLAMLLFFYPFAYSFPFCFSLLIAYIPQCIYYLLNVKSLLLSGTVPALERKDEQHQQSNMSQELTMGLVCAQHCPCFILFNPHNAPRQALLSPFYMQGTDRFKCPAQAYTNSKWWSQGPDPELTLFTPRRYYPL